MLPILSALVMAAGPQVHFSPQIVRLPVVDGKDLQFTQISTDGGLSHTRVQQIVQDDQGFIWFGRAHGLNRVQIQCVYTRSRQPNSIGAITSPRYSKTGQACFEWHATGSSTSLIPRPKGSRTIRSSLTTQWAQSFTFHRDRAGMLWWPAEPGSTGSIPRPDDLDQ